MRHHSIRRALSALLVALPSMGLLPLSAATAATEAALPGSTDRIIVKLRSAYRSEASRGVAMQADRTDALSVTAGLALRAVRPMSGDAQVLALPRAYRNEDVQRVVDRLRADPTVEAAYVDGRETLKAVPNDPRFSQQTYLQAPGAAPLVASVNAPAAWDFTKGTATAPIAVVDGGVRPDHPDLAGRLLPGYDFVSADCATTSTSCTAAIRFTTANDGDGRDADASDPGDWVTASDKASNPVLTDCKVEASSWHGTSVAGIIGATGNNAVGVTGLNWNASLVTVRVSGRCGGYQSDVVDGLRWAAGLAVPNVPNNTQPAKIINISLGSAGACAASAYSQAVADVIATGAVIVAAAGNEDAAVIRPANCPGVVSVGAVRGDGTRAEYSNSGANLTIMAPGGDSDSATNDLLQTTSNGGTTVPLAYSTAGTYANVAGTSFSTPVVSGVVSLMLSVNPALSPAQVVDVLRSTARPFATVAGLQTCVAEGSNNPGNRTACNCTTAACGAGYVDANAAVSRAFVLAGGTLPTTPTTPTTPTSGSSGGGGGGSIDATALLILAAVGLATRRVRRSRAG